MYMEKMAATTNIARTNVKAYDPRPEVPLPATHQPAASRGSNDPSSCHTSSRYPIPTFEYRVRSREGN